MAEITRERLARLRHQGRPPEEGEPDDVTVRLYAHELRALLDAADERDRLREAAKTFCDKLCPMTSGAYDIDYDALARLEALVDAPA